MLTNDYVERYKEENPTMDPNQLKERLLLYYKDAPISDETKKVL